MTYYFCVTDKSEGDSHSFVDGMLLGALSEVCRVQVVVAKGRSHGSSHENVVVAPFSRKGIGRVLYPLWALIYFLRRVGRGYGATVFVRNEIAALFGFSALKFCGVGKYRLRFQSSFPHERYSGKPIQRWLAGFALRLALTEVDVVFVVSQAATSRIRSWGWAGEVRAIPLCADHKHAESKNGGVSGGKLSFVYVGSCSRARRHDIIFEAARVALSMGAVFHLHYYGATYEEILTRYPEASETIELLNSSNLLTIHGRVDRKDIPGVLRSHDVGLNVIPTTEMFKESSSTKLGEYLSQGLPVLSTAGIPYHEYIHSRGDIGWLVDWNVHSIALAIHSICEVGRPSIRSMADRCMAVCRAELSYAAFVEEMIR